MNFLHLLRRLLPVCGTLLLLAGCLHERLAWAPDGSRATVITSEGLYLTDAQGTLSPLQLPRAYKAAWLGDSRQLVVAHTRPLRDFSALAATLGPERTTLVKNKAEAYWLQLQSVQPPASPPAIKPDADAGAILLYLREHHRDALRQKLGAEWKNMESAECDWHILSLARISSDRLELTSTLHEGLGAYSELRPAPRGSTVAVVTAADSAAASEDTRQVLLVALDGTTPPAVVATQVAASPDWSADGCALLCFRSEYQGRAGDLRLGTITAFNLFDAAGTRLAKPASADLAGVIFHDRSRLRALADGRVVFNAAPFHLPVAADATETREEFFVLSADRRTVTPLLPRAKLAGLPKSLGDFEVSPDARQLLVSDDAGKVWLLTLADGHAEEICAGFGKEDSIAPAWRAAGEFTFRRREGSRGELVHRRGSVETMLSRTWPAAVLDSLVK